MSERGWEGSRVLIVDDDEGMRDTLVDILQGLGYSVSLATDGTSAVQAIQGQDFALVLLDVRMPNMDGVETLRCIHALQPGMAVILMSGDPGDEAVTAVRDQAQAIVPKPLDLPALLPLIQTILSERTARL